MIRHFIYAALALALSAAPAVAGNREASRLQLVNDITSEVQRYTRFTIFDDVKVAFAEDDVVVLSGKVTMPFKKNDLERLVSQVSGVSAVRNEISVLPVSPFDDELRARIARAIYSHANFWRYAAMANPPIHIVVENGHVTLTGVVHNNVDRMLARSLATTYGAFSVRNNLKTDAEMARELERL
jgi:osmotically-inducible protein OsmY